MTNPKRAENKECSDEINVSAFKDVHIHFHGDVYLLAVWVAMSDRARSTPTQQSHTTLHGLASKFSSTYGIDYSNSLNSEDVMAIFRRHGIKGNPRLYLNSEEEISFSIPLK